MTTTELIMQFIVYSWIVSVVAIFSLEFFTRATRRKPFIQTYLKPFVQWLYAYYQEINQ